MQTPTMPATGNYHPLIKSVAHALRRRCGVAEGAHILVAVSGGADSVGLLRAIDALKDRRRWRLTVTVGHVQHHLRGQEAEGDARFVEELARQLKLPRHRRDLDLSGEAGNMEAVARRLRYRALVEMARECGAHFIATGHHGDDQLETLLMRMLRGAGTRGMSGIVWRRWVGTGNRDQGSGGGFEPSASSRPPIPDPRSLTLIRPMLAVSRSEIIDYLNVLNQPWREDHTNADLSRWRARLRAEVLPVLERIRPGAGRRATQFADHLRGVHRVLDEAVASARAAVEREGDTFMLKRETGKRLERVVLSGLLRGLLEETGVPEDKLGAKALGRVVRAVRDKEGGERVFEFARGVRVVVTRETLRVARG
ncbi:MAG: tRNA lysidine(34) synthetase TilS [Phycisphaerales bacterium]